MKVEEEKTIGKTLGGSSFVTFRRKRELEDIAEERAFCKQCEDCANLTKLPFGTCPINERMCEALKDIVSAMDDSQVVDTDKRAVPNVTLSITKGGWKCRYYERAKNPTQLLLPAPEDNPHRERRIKVKLSKPLVIK